MYEMPEVLVRYAVEQAGGTVSYNGDNGVTTVVLDGRTAYLRAGSDGAYIVNGRLVIKAEKLARKLYGEGYRESQWHQFVPKEGQSFDRALDAVLAFSSWYGPASRNNKLEYGASINKYGENDYRLEDIKSSDDNEAVFDPQYNERRVPVVIKSNTRAIIHTHWHPQGSLKHSGGDIFNFPNQLNGYPNLDYSYVVNRYNEIYVMSRWYKESVRSSQL